MPPKTTKEIHLIPQQVSLWRDENGCFLAYIFYHAFEGKDLVLTDFQLCVETTEVTYPLHQIFCSVSPKSDLDSANIHEIYIG